MKKKYRVIVLYQCSGGYEVEADDKDDAEEQALEHAMQDMFSYPVDKNDFYIEDVEEVVE